MIEIFEGIYQAKAELFLRGAASRVAALMVVGVIPCDKKVKKNLEEGEIWITDIQMDFPKRFQVPDDLKGYRADQILTTKIKLEELKSVNKSIFS